MDPSEGKQIVSDMAESMDSSQLSPYVVSNGCQREVRPVRSQRQLFVDWCQGARRPKWTSQSVQTNDEVFAGIQGAIGAYHSFPPVRNLCTRREAMAYNNHIVAFRIQ